MLSSHNTSNISQQIAGAMILLVLVVSAAAAETEVYNEGFENGWGWWYADNGSWSLGTPTAGPAAAFAGTACAGTDLGANYASGTNSRLISGPIDLPAAPEGGVLTLDFLGWTSLQSGDIGFLEFSTDLLNWSALGDTIRGLGQGWSRHATDLTPQAGTTVYLAFHLLDYTGSGTSYGWFLDEVRVFAGTCEPGLAAIESFDQGWGCWSTDGGLWEIGTPTTGPGGGYGDATCAGTVLGANYPATSDSRLISPSVALPAAPVDGQLWFDFMYWNAMASADSCFAEISAAGGTWTRISTGITGPASAWSHMICDISDYAGQDVRLAVHFADNGSATGNAQGIFVDDVKILEGNIGSLYAGEFFEDGWSDWYAEGGVWQVGEPGAGPGAAYEGVRCAATILNGNYTYWGNSRLISPEVILQSTSGTLHLSYWQWFSIYGGDYARVEISVDGSEWVAISRNYQHTGGTWTRCEIDVSDYIGQNVRFAFHLQDDGANSGFSSYTPYVTTGWYLDAVSLTEDPATPLLPDDFEDGMEGWYADGGTWEIGAPTSGPASAHAGNGCAATMLGTSYAFRCDTRLISPPVALPANKAYNDLYLSFWHWYSVWGGDTAQVEIRTPGGEWTVLSENFDQTSAGWVRGMVDISNYVGQTVQFAFRLLDDGANSGFSSYTPYISSGWYIDDLSLVSQPAENWLPENFEDGFGDWYTTNGTWDIGEPTSGPGAAYTGSRCAATNLTGNYAKYADSRLLSPYTTLPTIGGAEILTFNFRHWFAVYNGNDIAHVEIRVDEGPWETISENYYYSSGAWTKASLDVSAYAGQHVQFAFYLRDDGADSGFSSYSPYISAGWYIDDISCEVIQPLAMESEGFEAGLGNWSASRGIWQVGDPGSGPNEAHGGMQCAATVLGGNYNKYCESRLVSPYLQMPSDPADGAIFLGYWQWFAIYNANDIASVQVRPLGGDWEIVGNNHYGTSMGWTRALVDLSAYAGQVVQLGFYLRDDGADSGFSSYTPYIAAGWYLDDLEIIEGDFTLVGEKSFETSAWAYLPDVWGWSADNGLWAVGEPTSGPGAPLDGKYCAATVLDGNYNLRCDSRLVTPPLNLNSTPMGGKIWFGFHHYLQAYNLNDHATVEIKVDGGAWQAISPPIQGNNSWSNTIIDVSAYAGQRVRIGFHFTDDGANSGFSSYTPYVSAGWYIDKVALVEGPQPFNNPEGFESGTRGWHSDAGAWQLGTPTHGTSSGWGGELCYGTNLHGNYGRYTDSRLVTPAITLPAVSQLRWRQWFSLASGDSGLVEISVADGPWRTLTSYVLNSGAWSPGVIPSLAAYAGQEVRFAFHLKDNNDGSVAPGWFVDDVQVLGAPTDTPDAPEFLRVDYTADPPVLTWVNPATNYEWISVFSSIDPDFLPDLGNRIAMVQTMSYADVHHPGWRSNYKLSAVNAGLRESAPVSVIEVTGVDDGQLPRVSTLGNNFPNPFNPTTTIRYSLAQPGRMSLTVYNVRGQKVVTLDEGHRAAGTYEVRFDATHLASGAYFYRLTSDGFTETRKMLLLK